MTAPEAMTFDSLVTDIQNYCERSDSTFVVQIPRFIMLAESRISSEKKPLGLQRVVTGHFDGETLAKPVRWRWTRSISYLNSINKRVWLKNRSYEYCRLYWPDSSLTNAPLYYADYDYEHLLFSPNPDAQYTFEMLYYERALPLSSTNQTNWTTQYAPQVLLYASLIEAMPFLKNSERVPEFLGLYSRAIDAVVEEDTERVADATVDRSK